jgi:hypothetical protein
MASMIASTKYVCGCGSVICDRPANRNQHNKTLRHRAWESRPRTVPQVATSVHPRELWNATSVLDQHEPDRGCDRGGEIRVYVDTETTGLTAADRIVQVGVVVVRQDTGLQVLESWQTQVYPEGFTIPPSRFHRVTDAGAREHGQPMRFVLSRVLLTLVKHRTRTLWAYNAAFDRKMLVSEAQRQSDQWGAILNDLDWRCALRAARSLAPGLPSYRLASVYQTLTGRPLEQAHDALADAHGAAEVCHQLSRLAV